MVKCAEILLQPELSIAGNFKSQFSHADSNDSSVFAIKRKLACRFYTREIS